VGWDLTSTRGTELTSGTYLLPVLLPSLLQGSLGCQCTGPELHTTHTNHMLSTRKHDSSATSHKGAKMCPISEVKSILEKLTYPPCQSTLLERLREGGG
jgi:hypothetical protein